MAKRVLVACLALLAAGCAAPTDPAFPPADGYVLTATSVPASAPVGQNVTFHLAITGGPARTSDHIGAHYWANDTMDPTADFNQQAGACVHVPGGGSLPGEYDVTCKFTAAGTYYLRGHARYTSDGETVNDWSSSHRILAG